MERDVAKLYLSRAQELARFFCQGAVIDQKGADYDDYVGEMVVIAIQAWRQHGNTFGWGSKSEKRYVLRSMRNRGKELWRSAKRSSLDIVEMEPLDDFDLERQVIARQQLALLDVHLGGWQREILAHVAEGGSGSEFVRARGWHHSRLDKARKKARRILGADRD